jgi:hypothetical protein
MELLRKKSDLTGFDGITKASDGISGNYDRI